MLGLLWKQNSKVLPVVAQDVDSNKPLDKTFFLLVWNGIYTNPWNLKKYEVLVGFFLIWSIEIICTMLAAFTFTVEEIFLARKWKLSFCMTLNWKSISASAVSPSAKHLATVLAHVTIGFVTQTSCKRRIFARTCYLAWCGWGASRSKKQPYLLKGHWQWPRLCKSSPKKVQNLSDVSSNHKEDLPQWKFFSIKCS